MQNFRNHQNKLAYAYLLTPAGIEEKARISMHFLKYKMQEYERLRAEIEELQREAANIHLSVPNISKNEVVAMVVNKVART